MISDNTFAKVCTETLAILNNIPLEYYYKIPKDFINLLLENLDETYNFKLDTNKNFASQVLLPETIDLLAYIYRQFWCTRNQKNEFDKIMLENDKKASDKYDIDKIFQKRKDYMSQNKKDS